MSQRLPIPGQDDGTWGSILNDFLLVEHNVDGTLKLRTDGTLSSLNTALQPGSAPSSSSDLTGTYSALRVAKIQGVTISGTPSGGQVLTATSGSAASWQPAASGFADPTTIKGDLIVHGTGITTREPVGSDGQVLTADSTQATGIKWAALPTTPVTQVNGQTGNVTLTAASVGALPASDDLSAIATANATAGDVAMNSHKITGLANGTAASDAAAFGQIPTNSTFVDLTSNQTIGGNKTFSNTIIGNISGNAATVTTNANLTGPITSTGNATAVAAQTGTGSTFVMSASPALTGTPTAPTAAGGTNTTQIATTAFVAGTVSSLPSQAPVINVKDAAYGAKGDGVHDDTTAIQNAINAANTAGAVVYFPAGQYRVSQLTLLSGTILQGISSGTYPINDTLSGVSVLERIAGTNLDLLLVPDGNNYGRIFDLAIDGNKNNNTSGYGLKIADGASGQESQWIVERCYFHDNPNSNVYLGANRRANKLLKSVFNYSGSGDGVTVAGSDNTIEKNIIGSNARAGVCLGTTATQNWAASSPANAAAVAHVTNNDIYGNQVGVALASSASDCIVAFNGIDRQTNQGVTVYDGASNAIISNSFHSNGTATNNTYAHIDVASGVTAVNIVGNNFGPLDSGITNVASYAVSVAGSSNQVLGSMGTLDATSTVGGLTNASSNTPSWVTLSNAGARIKGSGNDIMDLYTSGGSLVFKMTGAGTPVYSGGGVQYTVSSGNVFGSATALSNTLVSFVNTNAANTILQTKNTAGQTANILTALQSDGTTTLAQIDKTGGISSFVAGTTQSRYVGATTGGAPTSGTFQAGDFIIDQTGKVWICTSAGTPGTWSATGTLATVFIAQTAASQQGLYQQVGTMTLTAQNGECFTELHILGIGGGASLASAATVHWRVKQQATMGSAPYVEVYVDEAQQFTANSLTAVLTTNTVSQTVVQLWMQAPTNFESYTFYEVAATTTATGTRAFAPNSNAWSVSLPTGTQTSGVPGPSYGLPMSLTGATAAARFVGATASGAPTSGTFSKGDYIIDQTGKVWICTANGTPGTWVQTTANMVTSSGGNANTIAMFNGSQTVANSMISQNVGATTATISGNLSLSTGSQYQINGTQIASSNLSDGTNLAKLNTAQTFTAIQTATAFSASGLTGATNGARLIGGTTSGSPSGGTYLAGDLAVDQTGKLWVYTGSAWTQAGGSGGLTLDSADAPLRDGTTATAGNSTQASPANHVHPRNWWTAEDHGLVAWSMDTVAASSNSAVSTAGTLYIARVHIPVAATATNLLVAVTSSTATLTSGQCFASLYTAAGSLVGSTADQSTAWSTSGLKTMALSGGPFALSVGDYYIGFYANGSALPSFARGNNQIGGAFLNAGLSSNYRFAIANTGLTTTPPGTLGTLSSSNFSWWLAIS